MDLKPLPFPEIPLLYEVEDGRALPSPSDTKVLVIQSWGVTELIDDTPPSEIVFCNDEFKTFPSDRLLDIGHPYELTRHAERMASWTRDVLRNGQTMGALPADALQNVFHAYFATADDGRLYMRDFKVGEGSNGWMHHLLVAQIGLGLEIPTPPISVGAMKLRDIFFNLFRGISSPITGEPVKGVVVSPAHTLYDAELNRVIYKLVSSDLDKAREDFQRYFEEDSTEEKVDKRAVIGAALNGLFQGR